MRYSTIFKTRVFRLFFLFVISAAIFFRHGGVYLWNRAEVSEMTLAHVQQIFPSALSFDKTGTWRTVYDANGNDAGSVLCTSPSADDILGYGGPVPLVIGVDRNKKIVDIYCLSNNETKSFVERLARMGFFDSWDGLVAEEAAEVEVDTVTGATVTSFAVIETVKKSLGRMPQGRESYAGFACVSIGKVALAAVVLLFALVSFFKAAAFRKYRWLLAGLSVVVIGFWNGWLLSIRLFYGFLTGRISLVAFPGIVLIAVLAVGARLLLNRDFYCSYVCPYGFAQELTGKLLDLFRVRPKKMRVTKRADTVLRKVRRIFLAVIVVILLTGVSFDLNLVEPFSAFLFRSAALFVLGLAGVFLLISVFLPRFWCRYLCPTGQLLEMFGRNKEGK